ncbi:MAG: hypothetical protein NVSMB27_02510 [Ktedonobacteraceae bacterium]
MLTALDHIIIGVRDLEQASTNFSQRLGLVASGGGIHPTGGTANRIIVIGDTYLELIAVRTPAEAQQSMLTRLAKGEGYLNFVLASNDIEHDSASMAQRGVSMLGPTPGQLKSAGGRSRGWSRTNVERPDLTQHYPFLIQHDSTGEERRFRLAGWTEPPAHPLGAVKVLSTTIAVANLAEAAPRFQYIYGLQPSENYTGEADGWEAMLVAFPLGQPGYPPGVPLPWTHAPYHGRDTPGGYPGGGGQSFELAEPLPLATDDPTIDVAGPLPEEGALSQHLQTFGESLCRMTIAVRNLAASRRYLDEHAVTYTYEEKQHPVLWISPHESCGAAIVLHESVA